MEEQRKTYHPPHLVEYGSLDTITLGSAGANTDQIDGSKQV